MSVLNKLLVDAEQSRNGSDVDADGDDVDSAPQQRIKISAGNAPVWFSLSHPAPPPTQIGNIPAYVILNHIYMLRNFCCEGLALALSVPYAESLESRAVTPAALRASSVSPVPPALTTTEEYVPREGIVSALSPIPSVSGVLHADGPLTAETPHAVNRTLSTFSADGSEVSVELRAPKTSSTSKRAQQSRASTSGHSDSSGMSERSGNAPAAHMPLPPVSETKKLPNTPAVRQVQSGSQVPVVDINKALRVLEQRAWDALQCQTPEEVVQKLLCEECHAALDSAVAFATDQNCIWMPMQDISEESGVARSQAMHSGSLDSSSHISGIGIVNMAASRPLTPGSTSKEGEDCRASQNPDSINSRSATARTAKSRPASALEEAVLQPTVSSAAVLPIFLQLRPALLNRSPAYHFRLFFVDGEWMAATPVSACTYYSDHVKYRDQLLNALYTYAASAAVKHMVQGYYARFQRCVREHYVFLLI
jgi:hypothetical protein